MGYELDNRSSIMNLADFVALVRGEGEQLPLPLIFAEDNEPLDA